VYCKQWWIYAGGNVAATPSLGPCLTNNDLVMIKSFLLARPLIQASYPPLITDVFKPLR